MTPVDLIIRPDGRPVLTGDDAEYRRLLPEFERSTGAGLLAMLSADTVPDAGPGYRFLRLCVRAFAMYIVRACEDEASDSFPQEESAALLASLPSAIMVPDLIGMTFAAFRDTLNAEARTQGLTPADCIRRLRPNWKDLGKVTFHLAENKKDDDGTKPFVFLATYQNKLSETGQVKHVPLASALKIYANDKKTLLSFLAPLKAASDHSEFLRSLLDDNRIFKPCFFSASDAWSFLRDTEVFKAEGIPVRLAGLWQNGRKRLKVDISLDVAKKRGLLTSDSLAKFSVGASVGNTRLTPEELADILNSKGGLIRVKGEWIEAETARVRELLQKWTAARDYFAGTGLSFAQILRILSGSNGLADDRVPTLEEDICEVNASPALSEAVAHLCNPESMALPPLPGELGGILRPYQVTGVKFLWNMLGAGFGVCLADDMGLGKTLQMISCIALLHANGAFSSLPALIVVPASLLTNWTDEFHKFAPQLRIGNLHPSVLNAEDRMRLEADAESVLGEFDAVLVTYAMVPRRDFLHSLEFPLIVLDEAQQIKTPSSQVSRSVRSLRAAKRVAMTGTPVENSLSDLWSIFDFICPSLLGSPDAFREFVRVMDSKKPHPDYTPLRKLVRPYILHRLKTDKKIISDLPDKLERRERTLLTPVQAKFYRRTVDAMKHDLETADEAHRNNVVLGYLLQFKQICDHPSLFSGNGEYLPERSGKFLRLGNLASQIARNGEKMLVFTQFRELTETLHEFLTGYFHRPGLILHGGTPVSKRAEFVQQFQSEQGPPFFVISLKAGGTGLTLTAASHVVHFDRWWNPAVENQATDRAYRIGQKRTVIVHKFVTPGTIEEKIDILISGKKYLASSLLERGSPQLLTEMSNAELLNFVRLDMDAVLDEAEEEFEK